MASLDQTLFLLINAAPGTPGGVIDIAKFVSDTLPAVLVAALLLGALFLRRWRRPLLLALLAMALTWLAVSVLRPLINAPRPAQLGLGTQWARHGVRPGFPSMHASVSFAFAGALLFAGLRWPAMLALLMAALVAASRVYLGLHFPSDVLAGALLGLLIGLLVALAPIRLPALLQRQRRPRSARNAVCWLTLWLAVSANWALWLALAHIGGTPRATLPLVGVMLLLQLTGTAAMLGLLAWSRWMKPLWLLIVAVAAFAQHYMLTYKVVIDPTMATNVLQTDVREVRDLLSWHLALNVALVVLPAAWWLARIRIAPAPLWSQLWRNIVFIVLALAIGLGGGYLMFRELGPLMRNYPQLRYMLNPMASVYSSARALFGEAKKSGPLTIISQDAALGPSYATPDKPPLLMLVVGETARGDHFSLNGYARGTNPELEKKRDVLSWRNSRSCGTSTAAALPCMFSPLARQAYDDRKSDSENLLDVLQAAGLAVLWIDNQSGCKGVCARVPTVSTFEGPDRTIDPAICSADGECLDGIMLEGLDARIAKLPQERRQKGVVLVLHQMGSHGPAYSKRSPPADKKFMPECTNITLSKCSQQELVNAFDNSIVYTDHVLAQSIDWLQAREKEYQTALLYVSDHGESLGESGLYLHGLPYAIAPVAQKHNAQIAWLDGGLGARTGVDTACVAKELDAPISHDNLYHTVLGLMDVESHTYLRSLDALASCRSAP